MDCGLELTSWGYLLHRNHNRSTSDESVVMEGLHQDQS